MTYTKPTIVNPSDWTWTSHAYRFQFGAYGDTRLLVFANGLDSGLETAAEWLAENAPGHLSQLDDFPAEALDSDGQPVDHTYTESGYLASWEWTVDEVDRSEWVEHALVEMLDAGELDEPYFDRFDICEAWYLWLTRNHGGQASPEYARLSRLSRHFRPRLMLSANRLGANALTIYAQLLKGNSST